MNKRGLSVKIIVEIIIAAIVVMLLAMLIVNLFGNETRRTELIQAEETLDRIFSSIDTSVNGGDGVFYLFAPMNWKVLYFKAGQPAPYIKDTYPGEACGRDNCICICYENDCRKQWSTCKRLFPPGLSIMTDKTVISPIVGMSETGLKSFKVTYYKDRNEISIATSSDFVLNVLSDSEIDDEKACSGTMPTGNRVQKSLLDKTELFNLIWEACRQNKMYLSSLMYLLEYGQGLYTLPGDTQTGVFEQKLQNPFPNGIFSWPDGTRVCESDYPDDVVNSCDNLASNVDKNFCYKISCVAYYLKQNYNKIKEQKKPVTITLEGNPPLPAELNDATSALYYTFDMKSQDDLFKFYQARNHVKARIG